MQPGSFTGERYKLTPKAVYLPDTGSGLTVLTPTECPPTNGVPTYFK